LAVTKSGQPAHKRKNFHFEEGTPPVDLGDRRASSKASWFAAAAAAPYDAKRARALAPRAGAAPPAVAPAAAPAPGALVRASALQASAAAARSGHATMAVSAPGSEIMRGALPLPMPHAATNSTATLAALTAMAAAAARAGSSSDGGWAQRWRQPPQLLDRPPGLDGPPPRPLRPLLPTGFDSAAAMVATKAAAVSSGAEAMLAAAAALDESAAPVTAAPSVRPGKKPGVDSALTWVREASQDPAARFLGNASGRQRSGTTPVQLPLHDAYASSAAANSAVAVSVATQV
jgi:hypothetical protein